eukprot:XP_011683347.1 PREDICTED: uncharacterized protein LOC105447229 [Strongylocentrotus purpuratus]
MGLPTYSYTPSIEASDVTKSTSGYRYHGGAVSVDPTMAIGSKLDVGTHLDTVLILDEVLSKTCIGYIVVQDTTPPNVTCDDVTTRPFLPNSFLGLSVGVSYTYEDSNPDPSGITYNVTKGPGGDLFPPGRTPVTMYAVDLHGNRATCLFYVENTLTELPVNCPDLNRTVAIDMGLPTYSYTPSIEASDVTKSTSGYRYHGGAVSVDPTMAIGSKLDVGTHLDTVLISDEVLSKTCIGYIVVQVNCSSDPCHNGGNCSSSGCTCPSGYIGSTCNGVDCGTNSCLNGATCSNDSCLCPANYKGIICETDVNECQESDPCANISNSFCLNNIGSYKCNCYEGHEIATVNGSKVCREAPTVGCASDSCLNGGTCMEEPTYLTCTCPTGYTGSRCERDLTCNGVICDESQTCFQNECACRAGTVLVDGICLGDCSPSCNFDRERCLRSNTGEASCECRPGYRPLQGSSAKLNCVPIRRIFLITFIIYQFNGAPAIFANTYLNPESSQFQIGSSAIAYVLPRVLQARGVTGIVDASIGRFYQGSLGVEVMLSADDNSLGNGTTMTSAITEEGENNDEHLAVDDEDIQIGLRSLTVAEIMDYDECGNATLNDCSMDASCRDISGVGFNCTCNGGFIDLYPSSLPGRYCRAVPGGSLNVGLIAGLTVTVAFLLLFVLVMAYMIIPRMRRRKHSQNIQRCMRNHSNTGYFSRSEEPDELQMKYRDGRSAL